MGVTVDQPLLNLFADISARATEPPERALLAHSVRHGAGFASPIVVKHTRTWSSTGGADQDEFRPALSEILNSGSRRLEPAVVLYRLDSRSAAGLWQWVCVLYQPDDAPIKNKMQYGSTRAAVLNAVGERNLLDVQAPGSLSDLSFPSRLRSSRNYDSGIRGPQRSYRIPSGHAPATAATTPSASDTAAVPGAHIEAELPLGRQQTSTDVQEVSSDVPGPESETAPVPTLASTLEPQSEHEALVVPPAVPGAPAPVVLQKVATEKVKESGLNEACTGPTIEEPAREMDEAARSAASSEESAETASVRGSLDSAPVADAGLNSACGATFNAMPQTDDSPPEAYAVVSKGLDRRDVPAGSVGAVGYQQQSNLHTEKALAEPSAFLSRRALQETPAEEPVQEAQDARHARTLQGSAGAQGAGCTEFGRTVEAPSAPPVKEPTPTDTPNLAGCATMVAEGSELHVLLGRSREPPSVAQAEHTPPAEDEAEDKAAHAPASPKNAAPAQEARSGHEDEEAEQQRTALAELESNSMLESESEPKPKLKLDPKLAPEPEPEPELKLNADNELAASTRGETNEEAATIPMDSGKREDVPRAEGSADNALDVPTVRDETKTAVEEDHARPQNEPTIAAASIESATRQSESAVFAVPSPPLGTADDGIGRPEPSKELQVEGVPVTDGARSSHGADEAIAASEREAEVHEATERAR